MEKNKKSLDFFKKTFFHSFRTLYFIIKETLFSLFYLLIPFGKLNRKYFILSNLLCIILSFTGYLYFPFLGKFFPKLVNMIYLYSFLGIMFLLYINLQIKRIRDINITWWKIFFAQFFPPTIFLFWYLLVFTESESKYPDPKIQNKIKNYIKPLDFWLISYTLFLSLFLLVTIIAPHDYLNGALIHLIKNNLDTFLSYEHILVNNLNSFFHLNLHYESFLKIFYVIIYLSIIHFFIFIFGLITNLTLRPKKYPDSFYKEETHIEVENKKTQEPLLLEYKPEIKN